MNVNNIQISHASSFFHLVIKGQLNYCNLTGAAIRTEKLCAIRRQTKLKLHAWPLLSLFFSFCEKYLSEEGKSNSVFRQIIRYISHLTISDTYELGKGSGAAPPLKNWMLQKVVKGHEQGEGQRKREGRRKGKGKLGSSTFWWLSIKLTKPKCLLKTEEKAAAWSILLGFSKS